MFHWLLVTVNTVLGSSGCTLSGVGRILFSAARWVAMRFRLKRYSGVYGRRMSSSPRTDFSLVSKFPTNCNDSLAVDLIIRGEAVRPSPTTYQFGSTYSSSSNNNTISYCPSKSLWHRMAYFVLMCH